MRIPMTGAEFDYAAFRKQTDYTWASLSGSIQFIPSRRHGRGRVHHIFAIRRENTLEIFYSSLASSRAFHILTTLRPQRTQRKQELTKKVVMPREEFRTIL